MTFVFQISGTIGIEEWIIAFFVNELYRIVDFPPEALHISRYEFQVALIHEGCTVYEANEKFNVIDIDNNGFLTPAEILHFNESTDKNILFAIFADWTIYIHLGTVGLVGSFLYLLHTYPTEIVLKNGGDLISK